MLEPISSDTEKRILVIGAGTGFVQVQDIAHYRIVGIVDRNKELVGTIINTIPVLGTPSDLRELFEKKEFTHAIISIGEPVPRAEYRVILQALKIPLVTVRDSMTKIGIGVTIGDGNLISAFCHFGAMSKVGKNNKFSSHCSIEHHAEVGDDCTFGPGVMTSGCVKIGSRVKFGTGIFIEPRITIGDDALIASGSVIVKSVEAGEIVRRKT